jgi:hypothetical protein
MSYTAARKTEVDSNYPDSAIVLEAKGELI